MNLTRLIRILTEERDNHTVDTELWCMLDRIIKALEFEDLLANMDDDR